jgi:hypothetical protein
MKEFHMSLINTEVKPFAATAYHNGKFVPVTQEDLKGKWSIVFFYPADFTFVCPTELGDLADNYAEFQKQNGTGEIEKAFQLRHRRLLPGWRGEVQNAARKNPHTC